MNHNRRMISLVLMVIFLVSLGCGFSASTAKIDRAVLARDEQINEPTTQFAPEDTFFCNVTLANAPDDTTIKAVWTAVDVVDSPPNLVIDESEIKSSSGVVNFRLENANIWPAGQYKVDLYLNDKLDQTLEFAVLE